jgi:hypothetical protein
LKVCGQQRPAFLVVAAIEVEGAVKPLEKDGVLAAGQAGAFLFNGPPQRFSIDLNHDEVKAVLFFGHDVMLSFFSSRRRLRPTMIFFCDQ